MILDAEKAVMDYLTTNMATVVGNGNYTVPIYRYMFPDDADPYAIVVNMELPGVHESVPVLMPVGIRVLIRAPYPQTAFALAQNIDSLLDKRWVQPFNSDTVCCESNRNSGPERIPSGTNALYYYGLLYTMILRGL